ncbi:HIT family protein [Nannocystis bainbridge]|uniref:HIT family protein n=1 Tax=Nannocystis bainbridge TaxID=2995303 RepID=A0ABT5DU28_9BACT|nr:HIT family protein [Nannocystis bainbridge]MDC0717149.1 HIT family protein [Nannocystis bainbridge]
MPSVFTRIINGELPGRFVYQDDRCAAFLSIAPLRPGHTLVVPKQEVDHWLDLDAELAAHLTTVAQAIGRGQMLAFAPARVGLMIAGLEVPHVHLHVVPIDGPHDLDFANADTRASAATLDEAADKLRQALAKLAPEGAGDWCL